MRRATVGLVVALLVVAPASGVVTLAGAADGVGGHVAETETAEDSTGVAPDGGDGLPERWGQTVGGGGDDKLATGVKTEEGYLVVGWSNSGASDGEYDGYAAMLDRAGNPKWEKRYGGPGGDRIYDVERVGDGYLVAGETTDETDGQSDGWVMKLGADGETEWKRTYETDGPGAFWALERADDRIYAAGWQDDDGDANAWAMELKTNGKEVWSETYETRRAGGEEYVNSIFVTGGGDLLLTGTVTSSTTDPSDAWVLRVGDDGDEKWTRAYGGAEYDRIHDAVAAPDGGYVLAGQTASQGEGEKDGWILKVAPNGDTRWDRTFGTERMDAFFGIHADPDGGYVVSGTKHVLGDKGADGWVVRTNGDGYQQWEGTYGGDYWDKLWPVIEGHDSGYLAIGESTSYDDDRDGWVVRLGGPAVAAIQDGNETKNGTEVRIDGSPVRAVTLSDANVSGVLAVAERANLTALSPPGDPVYAVSVEGPELRDGATARVEFTVRTNATEENVSDLRVARRTDSGWAVLETAVVSQGNGTAILSADAGTNATLAVTEVAAPTASLDATSVASVGESVTLSAASSVADEGSLAAYDWRVGQQTVTGETVELAFDEPGEREVELTVTDENGLRDSATATLVVNDEPEVGVEAPDSATVGEARTFSADVSDSVGDVTVTWTFDGATVTGESVEHSFGSPGTKTVTVVVEDEYGATATKEVEVGVEARGSDTTQTTTTPGTDTGGSVPGFGVGVALVALLGAALLGRAVGE